MNKLDSILKSRDITLPTKVCLVKAMVFPVVMYGCESWTIKKAKQGKIDAFELWCWRRLLRVPWTSRRSNQSILNEISPGCSLEGLMLKLKLQYFGHLMLRVDSLEKTLMLGGIEGRRRRRWQRMRWLHGITDLMDMGLSRLWEFVMDREAWRAVIHGVAKCRTELSDWTDWTEDIARHAHRTKDWAELASYGPAHPPPETGRRGQPELEGGNCGRSEAPHTKRQADFSANQDFWTIDIGWEGRNQTPAPQKRHTEHLSRCAHCTPRKPSGWDQGGVSHSLQLGATPWAKHPVTWAARTRDGRKTRAQPSLHLCGGPENLNLSGFDLGSACKPGPASDSFLRAS